MTEAASGNDTSSKPVRPRRRIAVVFVHGQGEQTPMTDVVQLVESVWRTDPRAQGGRPESLYKAAVERPPELAPVYSVPVYDQENSDQRRIVTRVVDGQQVDFYQFYWADLMEGSRITHLWSWFLNLMRRRPCEVPRPIWSLRQAAMAAPAIVSVWAVVMALLTAARLGWSPAAPSTAWTAVPILAALVLGVAAQLPPAPKRRRGGPSGRVAPWAVLALLLAGMAAIAFLFEQLRTWLAAAAAGIALAVLHAQASGRPPPTWDWRRRALSALGWAAFILGLCLLAIGWAGSAGVLTRLMAWTPDSLLRTVLVGAAAYLGPTLFFPNRRAHCLFVGVALIVAATIVSLGYPFRGAPIAMDDLISVHGAANLFTLAVVALAGFVVWLLDKSFLTPVMADSARMFSNSPVNVPNQNRIRDRGMRLLNALHDQTGERRYDRVVVLAHSLGTVVAYRLLAHYWGEVQPRLAFNGAAAQALAAEVEAAAAELKDEPGEGALKAWRAAVRAYGAALNSGSRARRRWLITDFVTIGSPLTYASLLMAGSDGEFSADVELYKRHPTSPPQGREMGGAMFDHGWLHHAGLFATTCWTNLYFPPRGLIGGDVIGGRIAGDPPGGLGRGVLDVSLAHDPTVRGFTHNEYWRWPGHEPLQVAPARPGAGAPTLSPHVAALRDALGLFHRTAADFAGADERLLSPEAAYP